MRNRMNICELCGHDSSEDGVLAHREQGDGEPPQAQASAEMDEEMESHGVLVEGKALRKWEADALIAARARDSKSAPARADEASK